VCYIIPIAFTSKDLRKVLISTSLPSYKQWIWDWTKQPLEAVDKLRVPAEALEITTPLIVDNWHIMLAEYTNRALANFFICAIKRDFVLALLLVVLGSSQQNGTYTVQYNTLRRLRATWQRRLVYSLVLQLLMLISASLGLSSSQ